MNNKIYMRTFVLYLLILWTPFQASGVEAEFDVFRIEIDPRSLSGRDGAPLTRDIYLHGGRGAGLQEGMLLDVYREKAVYGSDNGEPFFISIAVGLIEVVNISGDVAIARTIALASSENDPVLRYRAVMVGDYAIPSRRVKDAGAQKMTPLMEMQNPGLREATVRSDLVLIPSVLLFDYNSWQLKEEGRRGLDAVEKMFNSAGNKGILVAGHTCSIGSEAYNLELSKKRAISVASYLEKGDPLLSGNVRIEYYGEKRPIASNDTEEGRRRNRRVEVSFTQFDEGYLKDEQKKL